MNEPAALPDWLTSHGDQVRINVLLVPGSGRSTVVGTHDGALRIRVAERAVEGQANRALIALLAKKLGTAKSNVEIVRGHNSRRKVVAVLGVDLSRVVQCFDRPG